MKTMLLIARLKSFCCDFPGRIATVTLEATRESWDYARWQNPNESEKREIDRIIALAFKGAQRLSPTRSREIEHEN